MMKPISTQLGNDDCRVKRGEVEGTPETRIFQYFYEITQADEVRLGDIAEGHVLRT